MDEHIEALRKEKHQIAAELFIAAGIERHGNSNTVPKRVVEKAIREAVKGIAQLGTGKRPPQNKHE